MNIRWIRDQKSFEKYFFHKVLSGFCYHKKCCLFLSKVEAIASRLICSDVKLRCVALNMKYQKVNLTFQNFFSLCRHLSGANILLCFSYLPTLVKLHLDRSEAPDRAQGLTKVQVARADVIDKSANTIGGSMTVWLTSCITGLDQTKQVKLMLIQHKQNS